MQRQDDRSADQLRPLRFLPNFAPNASGSVLIEWGNTRVICSAMIEMGVPSWMKEQKVSGGWLTAEYSMLPYSTLTRKPRDSAKGKLDGRSVEIQRLIGRSLRAVLDLEALGPRTLWVDCDVVQADGGTRTASITGACVAIALAANRLVANGEIACSPLKKMVAAVSVGIVEGQPLLDLSYVEDRDAEVDLNLVMTEAGEYVEVQGSGEESVFTEEQLEAMMALGRSGILQVLAAQREVIEC